MVVPKVAPWESVASDDHVAQQTLVARLDGGTKQMKQQSELTVAVMGICPV